MPGSRRSRITRQFLDASLVIPAVKYKERVYPGGPYIQTDMRARGQISSRLYPKTHGDISVEIPDPKFVDYSKMESGFVLSPQIPYRDFFSRESISRLSNTAGESIQQKQAQLKQFSTEDVKRITRNYKPKSPRLEYPSTDNINYDRLNLKKDMNKVFHRLRKRQRVAQAKGRDISKIVRERKQLREMAKALGILGVSGVYLGIDD